MQNKTTGHFLGLRITGKDTSSVGGCLIIGIIISMLIGTFLIPYCINSWLGWAGKPPEFRWYYGTLIGVIPYFGYGSVVIAIITFIISFFV